MVSRPIRRVKEAVFAALWTAFTRRVSRATVPGDQGFPGKRPFTWGGLATKSATSTSRAVAMLSNQTKVGDDVPLRTSQKCPAPTPARSGKCVIKILRCLARARILAAIAMCRASTSKATLARDSSGLLLHAGVICRWGGECDHGEMATTRTPATARPRVAATGRGDAGPGRARRGEAPPRQCTGWLRFVEHATQSARR